MSQKENLERLNQLRANVSERDLKIWENVAYASCYKQATEKLKSEVARIKKETSEKKKESDVLAIKIAEVSETIDIQRQTLRTSECSAVLQKSLNTNLQDEIAEFQKKYDEGVKMYEELYQEYRSMYENSSKSYQNLKKIQTDLKKLQVEKMILDQKIIDRVESEKEFIRIQELILQKTIVKLAEFHILDSKINEKKKLLMEKKKEEKQLVETHLQLEEKVRKMKKQQMKLYEKPQTQNIDEPKKTTELDSDKLKQFISEDYQPCSLTVVQPYEKMLNFNQEKTKVKVLDTKIIKSRDLKKKIEVRQPPSFLASNLQIKSSVPKNVPKSKTLAAKFPESSQILASTSKSVEVFQPKSDASNFQTKPSASIPKNVTKSQARNSKSSLECSQTPASTSRSTDVLQPKPNAFNFQTKPSTPTNLEKSQASTPKPSEYSQTPVATSQSTEVFQLKPDATNFRTKPKNVPKSQTATPKHLESSASTPKSTEVSQPKPDTTNFQTKPSIPKNKTKSQTPTPKSSEASQNQITSKRKHTSDKNIDSPKRQMMTLKITQDNNASNHHQVSTTSRSCGLSKSTESLIKTTPNSSAFAIKLPKTSTVKAGQEKHSSLSKPLILSKSAEPLIKKSLFTPTSSAIHESSSKLNSASPKKQSKTSTVKSSQEKRQAGSPTSKLSIFSKSASPKKLPTVTTNSILKSSQENNTSKYFSLGDSKKKTVTFQCQLGEESILDSFPLYSSSAKKSTSTPFVNFKMFSDSLLFKDDVKAKTEHEVEFPASITETNGSDNVTVTAPTIGGTYDVEAYNMSVQNFMPSLDTSQQTPPNESFVFLESQERFDGDPFGF